MGMEGAVVKISTGADHDMTAMYKVNVEDLSQLLAYHEVFGKLNTDGQSQSKVRKNFNYIRLHNFAIIIDVCQSYGSLTFLGRKLRPALNPVDNLLQTVYISGINSI